MGFFSKIFKGIKKVFKKIGRAVKKTVKKFGKFMGKLGIVGQIGMMFVLPGIGGALMQSFGGLAGNMAGLTGAFSGLTGPLAGIVQGAGTVMKAAHGFVQTGINAFKTVSSGIMEFGKTALNKIPGVTIEGASANFFGKDSVLEGIKLDAQNVLNPFKSNITLQPGMTLDDLSKTTGLSADSLQQLNPNIDNFAGNFDKLADTNLNINLDFGKVVPNVEVASTATKMNLNITDLPENLDVTGTTNLNYEPGQLNINYEPGQLNIDKQFNLSPDNLKFKLPSVELPSNLSAVSNFDTSTMYDFDVDALFDFSKQSTRKASDFIRAEDIYSNLSPELQAQLPPQPLEVGDFYKNLSNVPEQKESLVDSLLGQAREKIGEKVDEYTQQFQDDPLGTISSIFGGEEEQIIEEDYGRRAPGLVVDAHTRFMDFTSNAENVMPIFNSGEFGVSAAIRDYMQQSYSNFQFPGAIPAR
tara:strand:- start:1878 stop:3287 length:1410 start_codon:yes stop_codon:yes gene_type:complete